MKDFLKKILSQKFKNSPMFCRFPRPFLKLTVIPFYRVNRVIYVISNYVEVNVFEWKLLNQFALEGGLRLMLFRVFWRAGVLTYVYVPGRAREGRGDDRAEKKRRNRWIKQCIEVFPATPRPFYPPPPPHLAMFDTSAFQPSTRHSPSKRSTEMPLNQPWHNKSHL